MGVGCCGSEVSVVWDGVEWCGDEVEQRPGQVLAYVQTSLSA